MGIDLGQLKVYVVQPVHAAFGPAWNTDAALVLSVGTAIHESQTGTYLHQEDNGPALGPWQMEPFTHDDCWANYLNYRADTAASVRRFQVPGAGAQQMAWNLAYACAMARVKYIRAPDPLPLAGDAAGLAAYYKRFYNSSLGAAVVDAALIECFRQAAAA